MVKIDFEHGKFWEFQVLDALSEIQTSFSMLLTKFSYFCTRGLNRKSLTHLTILFSAPDLWAV